MTSVRHLITGGAGFIAVNLARALIARGDFVVAVDDLSRGGMSLISDLSPLPEFSFHQQDCADVEGLHAVVRGEGRIDEVWHLAANSDIPAGVEDARVDLDRTFMTTFATLEVMKRAGIPTLHFASSSAVYGDRGAEAVGEDSGPLRPISNYGAMKLASEAQISAAQETFLERADIFRFPNVVGTPATHGVILDFIGKLRRDPKRLDVLGNGRQQKPYLHVHELIAAMLHIRAVPGRGQVVNIGPDDDGVTVARIAQAVRDHVSPSASIVYGQEAAGWVGDVPQFRYLTRRLSDLGWRSALSSEQAIVRAVMEIATQEEMS
ncbi:MAG: NAD-dependent epimerase/dehydratase family protein [Candidatus Brevundimonas colombiensis]|uniref:NAD-dependent epimerase/dehydratase family protein n=1 Tax=Candidatus Brevundimonas colombiensis TaxID=3121376 RepID=A0AAJ6BN89_9CAUL|nr:NAD-dependent epimerase/dehydratase family protein [Brevundimonas sp.]WEK41526.1 MAG: NAD-dependent epimerase/dehydratase family protein [Brevundimonas sp.]